MMSIIQTREGPIEPQSKRSKRSVACNYCRVKKVRCDGKQPTCANCLDRGEKCIYLPLRRRTRRESSGSNEQMLDRIARMEAMLKETQVVVPSKEIGIATTSVLENRNNYKSTPDIFSTSPAHTTLQWTPNKVISASDEDPNREDYALSKETREGAKTISPAPGVQECTIICSLVGTHAETGTPNDNDDAEADGNAKSEIDSSVSIAEPQNSHWEYHGPGSFLAICSQPGIDFVAEKTGVCDFAEVAKTFSRDVARPLKLERMIGLVRAVEPDRETAFRYSQTYFERTPEAFFDVVDRVSFQTRLRAQFENSVQSANEDDAAWYALRNIVYAFGCRYELGKASYSSTFIEAQRGGWAYFENAMSRHTELTFCRSGIMAVQALAVMALYAEGLGCPSVEYMLCAGAVRLAQSKGLHRQPGTAWNMTAKEILQRNTIFWSVYIYEKHIAHRSGRASAIDDDDISCHIPTSVPAGTQGNLELQTCIIKHAQISSRIGKRLGTAQAYRLSPEETINTIDGLHAELEEWKKSLPFSISPGNMIILSDIPHNMHLNNVIYLHYAYFGSLITIHSGSSILVNQVKRSSEIVAESSRNIILATKYISDVYAWTPVWLAFYYPALGLINLFVHILKDPLLPTVQSDLALCDMVAGHFARLEFASSGQLSFSFAREVSSLARIAVKYALQKKATVPETADASNVDLNQTHHLAPDEQQTASLNATNSFPQSSQQNVDNFDYPQMNDYEMTDFDMENWSALLPSFSPSELLDLNGMPNDCETFLA